MPGAVHHALLGLACLALLAAGHRLAARLSDHPVDRILAAFVLAAAAAVIEALALGLVSAGSDTVILTAAAIVTFLVAVAVTPRPSPPTHLLLSQRWGEWSNAGRAAGGAAAGVALLLVLWPLRFPAIGFDGSVYHLPEIAGWVASGRPGAIEPVSYLFPFANYPVTNEVALTWAAGISRSLVPVVIWNQVLLVVTAGAALRGLRALNVPWLTAILAAGAVLATPVLLTQSGTPSTDVAGLAWLTCAAALTACARRSPGLAVPGVIAAGMAIGSKTTTAPLALAVGGLIVWGARGATPRERWWLAAGTGVALLVGATWAVRNAVTHGWALWPFASGPRGDPVPRVWHLIEPSLASRPRATVEPRASGYLELFAGALLLFVGGALAWIANPRRLVAAASLVAMAALGLWVTAPSTGQPDSPVFAGNPLATTRYALPAIAAAAAAIALAGGPGTRASGLARTLLGGALLWSLAEATRLEQPSVPAVWALATAGAAGAALGLAVRRSRIREALVRPGGVVAALVAGVALGVPSTSLISRQAEVLPAIPGTGVVRWARSQPGFASPQSIAFAGTVIGQFAGDGFEHRLVLLSQATPCTAVRARAATGLVVVADQEVFRRLGVPTPAGCLEGMPTSYEDAAVRVYGRLR